ncbi:TonB-dependent receptor, partial [Microbulbifer taiwanensis]|uniref:TonB-dependent receptor n=1 Tax=Microbulbifer taiwanensis TaxID=986746 RepID=UPI001865C468
MTDKCASFPKALAAVPGAVLCALVLSAQLAIAAPAGAGLSAGFYGERVAFDIPAQPLERALTTYGEQSGVQIFFRSSQLPEGVSATLRGSFTRDQALERLLAASNLSYSYDGNNTLVIRADKILDRDSARPAMDDDGVASAPTSIIEETYVTGLRSTLSRNLAIKRFSENLVDVITAEDIGKFPDRNVADSLQRVAGVSVDRLWGEGRDVNIRGTDKDINRTLLNGQHVASAYWWANDNLSRGFNYSTLASELVQSLEVHKTSRADLDEGSIGGAVLVRTRKPLDMAPLEAHLSLGQQYSELAESWDPQGSFLGSWKSADQTLGLLASANWQNRGGRRDGLETFADNNLYRIVDTAGNSTDNVYAIWGGGSAVLQQQRTHITSNLTLQWAPHERWDSSLNLLRSRLDIDNSNHNFLFSPGGYKLREELPVTVERPRYLPAGDGNLSLVGGTLTNADSTGAILDSIHRQAYIDTAVNDLDIHYRGSHWHSHMQLGSTDARGGTERDRLYRFTGNSRVAFRLGSGRGGGGLLGFKPLGPP